jgi:uncharacterized protein (DUF2384 family)
MGNRNRKSTHRNLKETELASSIADVLRVVVKALDAYSERADARFVEQTFVERAVVESVAVEPTKPVVTADHRRRAERVLRRAGVLR